MRPHSREGRGSGSPPPLLPAPLSPSTLGSARSPAVISVQQYYYYPGYQQYACNINPQITCSSVSNWNRGSNTLAIDNKIGEAMDLVKSHLMLTVRAEVAVLKEEIKELKEKNSKLEYENSILKSSASPETLTKLSQP